MPNGLIGLNACCVCISLSKGSFRICSQKSACLQNSHRYSIFFLEEFIWSQGQPVELRLAQGNETPSGHEHSPLLRGNCPSFTDQSSY